MVVVKLCQKKVKVLSQSEIASGRPEKGEEKRGKEEGEVMAQKHTAMMG